MCNSNEHHSVFLNEAIDCLNIKPNGIYVDCTLGRSGHSLEILKKLGDGGKLVGIDCDEEAILWAKNLFTSENRIHLFKSKFSNINEILKSLLITEIDGCLFDLGVSSPQLDNSYRGFSYHTNSRLDMRMDQSQDLDAHYVVNNYSYSDLKRIFKEFGESNYSSIVAKAICNYRKSKIIDTNNELVEIIKNNIPKKELLNKHPARVFFQAIRIEVNDEKNEITKAIKSVIQKLKVNGRLVVISFHSLENKWVKQAIRDATVRNEFPSYLPIDNEKKYQIIKPPKISSEEINSNRRSRSAKLHIIERSL